MCVDVYLSSAYDGEMDESKKKNTKRRENKILSVRVATFLPLRPSHNSIVDSD